MKIENFNPFSRIENVSKVDKGNRTSPAKTHSSDKATLSEGAQLMSKALDTLKESPEVRQDRLDEVRAKILSGEYQINYSELAKKLAGKIWLE